MHACAKAIHQRLQAIDTAAGGDHTPSGFDEAGDGGAAESGGRPGDECGLEHASILTFYTYRLHLTVDI
jgi:hypothetical protein